MISVVSVEGVREKEEALVMMWYYKHKRNGERKISGFRMVVNDEALERMEKTTRAKTDLLISQIHRLLSVKKIKTLKDLRTFVNGFVMKYNPYILFNGRKTFEVKELSKMEINSQEKHYTDRGYKKINKKYFKKRYKEDMKKHIKQEQETS